MKRDLNEYIKNAKKKKTMKGMHEMPNGKMMSDIVMEEMMKKKKMKEKGKK